MAGRRRHEKVALGEKVQVEGLSKAAVAVIVVAGAARRIADVKAVLECDSLHARVKVLGNVLPQRHARLAVLVFPQGAEDLWFVGVADGREKIGNGSREGTTLYMTDTAELTWALGPRPRTCMGRPTFCANPSKRPVFFAIAF